ncbi:MAG TPA: hypothetical protein DD640_02010 [Clostridiales bacterium]|nr:hypothetical protein [Clostridiales bacterium]
MSAGPVFLTSRLQLRILDESAAPAVLNYYLRNRQFHQPWFAQRPDSLFTEQQQAKNLAAEHADFLTGRAVPFWLSLRSDPDRIIGRFAATSIVHGCFNSGFTAWHLDKDHLGTGLAREAGQAAIPLLFSDFRLHRLEANIMPGNFRSINLAENLGFRLEGFAPRYLKINGRWEDHLHFVRLSDDPPAAAAEPPLETGYLLVRRLRPADLPSLREYYDRNLGHLYAWNPVPVADLGQADGWRLLYAALAQDPGGARRLDWGVFLRDRPQHLVGTVECRNLLPLPWSSCEIGFSLDHALTGRGLMPEILTQVINWLLVRYGLRRITALCCAGQEKSQRLLELLGFRQEGVFRQAMRLLGGWQELVSLALLRDEYHPAVRLTSQT